MVINKECKKCQIKRNVDKYPDNVTKEEIKKYQYEVNEIIREEVIKWYRVIKVG